MKEYRGRVVSDKDYRYDLEKDVINLHYESPANEASNKRLDRLFCRLSRSKTLECKRRIELSLSKDSLSCRGSEYCCTTLEQWSLYVQL